MEIIDVKTVFIIYVITNGLCASVMASLWLQNRRRFPEIALWLINFILQFIAVLLIVLRGVVPDFFSIVLANTFVVGGAVILYIGLERYVGKKSWQIHNYVMVGVFMLAHAYFTYVYSDLALRNINFSLGVLYICAQATWLMLRRAETKILTATRATGIVLAIFCFVSLVRIIVNLMRWRVSTDLFKSGLYDAIILVIYPILFIALTFTLVLMVSRRFSVALEHELIEHQRVEQRIKQSEENLKEAQHIAQLGNWELDLMTNTLHWSDGIYELFEIDPNKFGASYEAFLNAIHPDDRAMVNQAYTESLKNRTHYEIAHRLLMKDGRIKWVNEICRSEFDKQGNPLKSFGIVQDITRQKQAEEQIKLNTDRLTSLLNIIQYRTNTTQEFLDYALNEVIKLTQSKIGYIYFYHEDQRQFVLNTWSKDVMKECTIANPQTCYELDKTGVWGEAVRQRKPIILNDFEASHPLKKGYPEGHAPLKKFMTVPVFKEDKIVAVVGVANKVSDYNETDVLQLTLFMDAVWKSVEIKTTEEKLRESEESIRAITDAAKDAIMMIDNNGNTTYWNPAAEHILGYKREEVIGKNLHGLIVPERFLAAHNAAFPEFQKTGRGNAIGKTLELAARRKDGQEIDIALSLSSVNIKGEWNGIGIIQDITDRKKAEEKLKHMATHDSLTDLPTLKLAEDRLAMAMGLARRHKEKVAVMFMDLDGFKRVNDTLGHDAGDFLLKTLAQRLLSSIRKTDTIARVGGDEFLLIATELKSSDDAANIANKVVKLVAQPVNINGHKAAVSASIGIAFYPDNGEDINELIKLADEAMYRIKNSSKNGFGFAN
ncbi:MAG: diguanylate cyclase [Syntrophaceae bacterium]|nr:diguanylate cyclase [Syntrophaceae bacterium]